MSKPISFNMKESFFQAQENQKPSPIRETLTEVISGGVGGAAGGFAITPFMYFKMHMQGKAQNPTTPPVFQKNPVKWFVGGPTLAAGMFPVCAFQFFVNSALQNVLSNNGERELSPLEKLACSVTTGAVSTAFVGPQELIFTQQQRLQAEQDLAMKDTGIPKEQRPKISAMQVVKKIFKEHGAKGFYRAGWETAGREAISASILTNLAKDHPFLSPVIGAALSQPLDGRKTNKQIDFSFKEPIRELFRKKAFAGLVFGRIPVYLVYMNVAPIVKDMVATTFNKL